MAWVANKSTTVRNAVNPITIVRRNTPEERAFVRPKPNAVAASLMTNARRNVTPHAGRHACSAEGNGSHIVIALVVQHITHEQNDGLAAEILPPVRSTARLRPDVAGLVHDRIRAVACVFDDLALGDIDDRRTVGVAVPGHDTAGLDRELAEAKLAFLDVGRLLLEVDGGEHRVGDALPGMGDRRAHVGLDFAGWGIA